MHLLEPQTRRWTKAEYYHMAELGWFEGQRVELVEGEVVVMSPEKPRHYSSLDRVADVVRALFGAEYWVRAQAPLDLGESTEPEPDVAVVRGRRDLFERSGVHPTTAVLIVEVSESSLIYDRTRKGSLYAARRIADYWIVNLAEGQLEVYRDPTADPSEEFGFRYQSSIVPKSGESVTPLALPDRAIRVADLLC
jgi:Uma2 family endonuclease